jgi:small-conductance mechanosensitive channel/CRP-like cAMP-binding protein
MVELITLQESLAFSAGALLFGLITMRLRPELRRSVLITLLLIALGLGGLSLLSRYQIIPAHLAIAAVPREVCLLVIALGNIRIYITFLVNVILARRAVPRIVGEVSIALSLIVFTLVRLDAVGVNLTSLIATTAVGGAAIAFAMQSTLGNLLGGISLQLDNTCRIGDWIEIEGVTGEVVGIRWRYTALATVNNVTIIIPNAALMNNRVTLLGRRGDERIPWRRPIEFTVGYEWTPGQVMAVANAALERVDVPCVAADPPANCMCAGFDSNAIKYIVYYWLTDIKQYLVTDSRVRVHVYAALGRAGMDIPISRSDIYLHSARGMQAGRSIEEQQYRVALLQSLNLFASLTDEETQALARLLIPTPMAVGDVATKQGEPSDSLYILARGQVGIFRDANDAKPPARQRLATLPAPQYFGEMGLLTGQARTATILAESDVLCYRLDKRGFEAIIRARPEIAEAMSHTVAARQAANDATLASLSADARARATGSRASDIVRRIRAFFGL